MRLKTKLVLAISLLVFFIAGLLSLVYVNQLLHAAVQQAYDTNHMVASQIRFGVQRALEHGLKDRRVDPNQPEQLRQLAADAIRTDDGLNAMLESVNRYSLTVYDAHIADSRSVVILSTNPDFEDKPAPQRDDYRQLLNASPLSLVREVFGQPRAYDVVVPLDRNGQPFLSVHVGVRTTLLRAVYAPWLTEAVTLMTIVLIATLIVALLLSNLALRPLEQISQQLDRLNSQPEADDPQPAAELATQVSHKIERIGQRMRNVEEVFSALKDNLDQILGNLEDGLVLVTADGRTALVSESARRFLGVDAHNLLGVPAAQLFDRSTELGRVLTASFSNHRSLVATELAAAGGRRTLASVEFLADHQTRQGLGALVTLRDLDSVAEIGSELELSRRMAAIGRLTSGVGHEVKNPINAIVVHLELLKNKLADDNAPALRHLQVIDSEIHRLDRVVQTLVDFSRPVDLDLREHDVAAVLGDVLTLSSFEFAQRGIEIRTHLPARPLVAKLDADLLKQAVLNVLKNGAQAMNDGGLLDVSLSEELVENQRTARLAIRDHGAGILPEIREKIFDLYFTTKTDGSGIGLAMTYRILQLHHGSIEVQSELGSGSEFILRIPLAATDSARRHPRPAADVPKGLAG